jgi:hypothetical protein
LSGFVVKIRWAETTCSKVKVTLRPKVCRPVRLGARRPSGTRDQFFFLLEILPRHLRVCYFVAPSLRRGRVCNLLLLLVLTSAVPLGSALSDERLSTCSILFAILIYEAFSQLRDVNRSYELLSRKRLSLSLSWHNQTHLVVSYNVLSEYDIY